LTKRIYDHVSTGAHTEQQGMKITAVCCTWCRPVRLSYLIRCFELQDHPHCELVILDDAGQYQEQSGQRWRLVSVRNRYPTLGDKRNAATALISRDTEAIAVFDDDDLYLPWALSAVDAGLRDAEWTRPSQVLVLHDTDSLMPTFTGGLYHAAWGYRRELFEKVGRYPSMNSGEDQHLAWRFHDVNAACSDPIELGYRPYYIYWWADMWHISAYGDDGYERLGELDRPFIGAIAGRDPPHVDLRAPRIME
jgi:hypothetical protein